MLTQRQRSWAWFEVGDHPTLNLHSSNKMQFETADFAPGAATLSNSTKQHCLSSD